MVDDRITFYADDDVNGPAIQWAKSLGIQIVSSNEADNRGAHDPIHFSYAIEHNYVIVTGNKKDYEPLYFEWAESGADHPGMVLIGPDNRNSSGYIAQELLFLYELADKEYMKNRIVRI
jgi:hypothetical protein